LIVARDHQAIATSARLAERLPELPSKSNLGLTEV
jgi:hypothetical protein